MTLNQLKKKIDALVAAGMGDKPIALDSMGDSANLEIAKFVEYNDELSEPGDGKWERGAFIAAIEIER